MELNELAKHGRPYATWKKAFNHLKMKYSKIKIFSKINAKRIMVNTLSQNLQNY